MSLCLHVHTQTLRHNVFLCRYVASVNQALKSLVWSRHVEGPTLSSSMVAW